MPASPSGPADRPPSAPDVRVASAAARDVQAMYPALREDHLRYLRKWGFIAPAPADRDARFSFAELAVLRHVNAELQAGRRFRAVLREMQASRAGQLAFDFRLDAPPARIATLAPRQPPAPVIPFSATALPPAGPARPLTHAEEAFLAASELDDGSPDHQEEAARAYRRALQEDPDLVAAVINLANIRYSRDELAEAQALYERAITLDPAYFEAYFNLGNIHHDHGRFADAEECYRRALALNPGYADAHFYLAVTLEKMGRSPDARPHWKAYQQFNPDGEWSDLAREFSD